MPDRFIEIHQRQFELAEAPVHAAALQVNQGAVLVVAALRIDQRGAGVDDTRHRVLGRTDIGDRENAGLIVALGGLCRGLRRRLAACADLLQEIERRRQAGGELHRPVDRGQRCDPITQIAQGLATIDIAEWVFRIETDRHVVIGERLGIPALQCQRRAAPRLR